MVFSTASGSRHKCFLHGLINVAITKHIPRPSVPKDGSEELPIKDVEAMGLKLDGCDASLWAVDLPISIMAASFHDYGTVEVDQQVLN